LIIKNSEGYGLQPKKFTNAHQLKKVIKMTLNKLCLSLALTGLLFTYPIFVTSASLSY